MNVQELAQILNPLVQIPEGVVRGNRRAIVGFPQPEIDQNGSMFRTAMVLNTLGSREWVPERFQGTVQDVARGEGLLASCVCGVA